MCEHASWRSAERLRFAAWLPALAVVLLPKCPLCLAAYGGLFAFAGLSAILVHPAVIVGLAAVSLLAMLAWAWPRRRLVAMGVATVAVVAIVVGRWSAAPWLSWTGIAALVLGYFAEPRLFPRRSGCSNPETHCDG